MVQANNACALGESILLAPAARDRLAALIDGQPAGLDEAVERAAQILMGARYPLIYGLSEASCEAQAVAVAIADRIGGCIDIDAASVEGAAILALQTVGEVTCTLGEVRDRADLVIFWRCDPVRSHPRLLSRYLARSAAASASSAGHRRTLIVVDTKPTDTSATADHFFQLPADRDFDTLWALRALVRRVPLDARSVAETGLPLARLQDLEMRLRDCHYGVLFFGPSLSAARGGHRNVEAALMLVRDLNTRTRFRAVPLRGPGNAAGAENVLTWQTGYPFGVSFHRGFPCFGPGEFTGPELLLRGEADAALIIATDPAGARQCAGREHLARIPYVAVDWRDTETMRGAAVAFPTASYITSSLGTVYRMDNLSLPLRPSLASPRPPTTEVLTRLERRIRDLQRAGR